MNIFKLMQDFAKADPEVYRQLNSRRDAFKNMAGFGKKITAAAIPVAFAAFLNKAYGQSGNSIAEVLNFALTLKYLEDEFYKQGLAAPLLIPAADRTIFTQIGKQETAHVKFLEDTIKSLGASPVTKPAFDFSGKGAFQAWNTDYQVYLTLAQAFEDMGVRAYKGQAGHLISNKMALTAALQIHSAEARHAAMVRKLRGEKSWIPENISGGAPAAVYAGEDNVKQGLVNDMGALAGVSGVAATEAFDEPLDKNAVLAIAGMFIV